jgi:hypothetical protein
MSRRMKNAATARMGTMNSDTEAPSGMSPPSSPTRKAQVANTCVESSGPPEVSTRTMSKFAKVTISENNIVMAMMLRIIGRVISQMRCHQDAPSIAAASYNSSGTDFSAARYMIMKNGAPTQTLTRMTEKRAQPASPSHSTRSMPKCASTQFNALNDGSNSHSQASVLIAGGMTQGTSSMPRHLR